MSKGKGWHGNSYGHRAARQGISVKKMPAHGVSENYDRDAKAINDILGKHWQTLVNSEINEVVQVGEYQFEIIDKQTEMIPKPYVKIYILDDLARTNVIEYQQGWKTAKIEQSDLFSNILKKGAQIAEAKEKVVNAYNTSAVKTGRALGRSAKVTGRLLGRTKKAVEGKAKRAGRTVTRIIE